MRAARFCLLPSVGGVVSRDVTRAVAARGGASGGGAGAELIWVAVRRRNEKTITMKVHVLESFKVQCVTSDLTCRIYIDYLVHLSINQSIDRQSYIGRYKHGLSRSKSVAVHLVFIFCTCTHKYTLPVSCHFVPPCFYGSLQWTI